ncbi:MAG: ShlB/FhaC/HecB family hemolysin secretion/activation protein [Proteobacteria bacterium]|nr:ShlB/FhaC/HecB family hemolysin secretion/activation protein [Pseudomonadota bacterium]
MKKLIAILFLCCCFSQAYAASEADNIANQQGQVIQNQKQIDRQKELQVELKQVTKDQAIKGEEEELEEDLSENDGKIIQNLRSIQCFRPQKITFLGSKLLTAEEEKSLSEKYLDRCFTLAWLKKFDQEVDQVLFDKGYVTSHAKSSQQSLISGDMTVEITAGILEKIIINEDSFSDKAKLLTTFGFDNFPKGGRILNIQEIDPALKRFNKLRSNNATIKITPSKIPNHSIIVIENHPKDTARINFTYDNIGSKTTGENRDTIAFAKDNLLHLNDSFNISRTSNDLDPQNNRRYNQALSGSWSVPFGVHNFTLSATKNSYSFLTGSSGKVLAQGFTLSKSFSIESLLFKSKGYKISSNFALNNRDNQIFTNDVRNESQSRKASIVTLAIPSSFLFDSSTLFLKPSYSKSLNILNAKTDNPSVSRFSTHAEIEIFKFYANYEKKIVVPYFKNEAFYNVSLDSQLSKNHLYSVDQFSSGGFYSVRGFRSGSILGDSGYNIRNEVTMNLGKLISAENNLKNFPNLNHFSLSPFYDYGSVQNRGVATNGRLSSVGFKIGFSKKNTNASLTFSHALSRSRILNQSQSDNNAIYFDTSFELDFL